MVVGNTLIAKQTGVRNAPAAFTLIEVLTVTVLLSFFLVGFYEGSQRMASAAMTCENRNEAMMQSRRLGNLWQAGGASAISGITGGNFLNGIAYTLSTNTLPDAYTASGSTLTRLALTLGWNETDPNSSSARPMRIKDVYFRY